jgi:hypothetical protein
MECVVSPSIRTILSPAAPAGPPFSLRAYRDFYRDPASRLALLVTTLMMCYVGGIAMFWFHAVYLDEGGPAISWVAHWLLDSSFAFVALTPALALIMPFAVWVARAVAPASKHWIPWLYAAVAGTAFAVVTTPGPIAHDMIIGRGTWVAEQVTQAIGDPSSPLPPAADYPPLAAMAQQLGAGVPLYIALMALTVVVLRTLLAPRLRGAGAARPGGAQARP